MRRGNKSNRTGECVPLCEGLVPVAATGAKALSSYEEGQQKEER